MTYSHYLSVRVATAALLLSPLISRAALTDTLMFGAADSEKAHALSADRSDTITGGLGQSARRLLPLQPESWEGGSVSFLMRVDPDKPNYFTARFWGSDLNENRLLLYCEGKQIGYRHLGDVDLLDSPNGHAGYAGRFYYNTSPLPITGDSHARERVQYIVNELGACQEANGDGYVLPVNKQAFEDLREGRINASPFALNGVWAPFYTQHKVLAGLRDSFRFAKNGSSRAICSPGTQGRIEWILSSGQ